MTVGGSVSAGHTQSYYYNITQTSLANNAEITITADAYDASVFSMFVILGPSVATPGPTVNDYYSTVSAGTADVVIHSNDTAVRNHCPVGSCVATIAIFGHTNTSTYSLTAFSTNDHVQLLPGVAYWDVLPSGGSQCYQFTRTSNTKDLKIELSPLSGDPDLFVDHAGAQHTCPGPSHSTWSSQSRWLDIVTIPASDCTTLPCTYTMTVYAYGDDNTLFTLRVANATDPVQLLDGLPQDGQLRHGEYADFSWNFEPSYTTASLTLVPISGDPDLYVKLGGAATRFSYDYAALSEAGTETITVRRSDAMFHSHCPAAGACAVSLRVYGYSACAFQLVANHDSSITQLAQGVPAIGSVGDAAYRYFFFDHAAVHKVLRITVTALSGDPDLFVSNTVQRPTSANFTWYSIDIGNTSVTITPFGSAASCPTSPCRYYIGVRGFAGTATFTVLADVVEHEDASRLVDGYPQFGTVSPNTLAYYEFDATNRTQPPVSLEILGTPLAGRHRLYVSDKVDSLGRPVYPALACAHVAADGTCVTYAMNASTYGFSSDGSTSSELVSLAASAYTPGSRLIVAVAPFPTFSQATFLVTATSSDFITALQDGVPTMGVVYPGHYRYYFLHLSEYNKDVAVTINTLHGLVDMYGSTTVSRPNTTDFEWAQFSFKQQFTHTVAASSLPAACTSALRNGAGCNLYIAVHGHDVHNSSFYLTASTVGAPQDFITLVDGQSATGSVNASQFQYYQGRVASDLQHDIVVTLSSVFGDADLYVTVGKPGVFPNASANGYDLRSISALGVDTIRITPADPLFCTSCVVNIGVRGFSDALYRVTFATTNSLMWLVDSVPTPGYAPYPGNYTYFRYLAFAALDFEVILTTTTGNVDLTVAVYNPSAPLHLPTMATGQWTSTAASGDQLVIHTTDAGFAAPASYVIGVYAHEESVYTLVASARTASQVLQLYTNEPQDGHIVGSTTDTVCDYYSYTWGAPHTAAPAIAVSTLVYSGTVFVYATNGWDGTDATLPNPTNAANEECIRKATGDSMVLDPAVLGKCFTSANVTWTLGVCAPPQPGSATYRLTVSHAHAPVALSADVPSDVMTTYANETQLFYYQVGDTTRDVLVTLTAETGNPDLVASFQGSEFGCKVGDGAAAAIPCASYQWASTNVGDDTITIRTTDARFPSQAGATLYLGVFSPTETAVYTVLVRQGSQAQADPITLLDGVPQLATTADVEICPHRNSVSGTCAGDAGAIIHTRGAYFTFDVPAGSYHGDAYLMVAKRCATPNVTNCAPNLNIYVNGCPAGNCSVDNQFPDRAAGADTTVYVSSPTGAVHLQRDNVGCYGDSTTDCRFYVGVFTQCAGFGCGHANFTITYSTPKGTDVVPEDCINSGGVCELPEASYPTSAARTYELFTGIAHGETTVMVQACSGSPAVYVCYGHGGSRCTHPDPTHPSPVAGNYDQFAVEDAASGIATLPVSTSGLLYATVTSTAAGSGTYILSVAKGIVPVLAFWPSATGVVDTDASSVTVSWAKAQAFYTGQTSAGAEGGVGLKPPSGPPVDLSGEEYYVIAVPTTSVPTDAHMQTACGAYNAYQAALITADLNQAHKPFLVNVTSPTQQVTISGMAAGVEYAVTVIASCMHTCAPSNVQGQVSGSPPIYITPGGAQPSPGPHGNNPGGGGMGAGAKAGIAITVLVVVGAGVGAAFWWFRKKKSKGSVYDGGYYPATSAEGGDSYAPL